ncbi:unnamed protein product [Onchocerca flexuosa]|uniref:Uncharacterized protein n=1 Tax=Onchocerca flexuosa TaxID=387005 RepID=A0A183HKS0_9BILA|nr:unnamed protein product [Onchocerca flexuosa]
MTLEGTPDRDAIYKELRSRAQMQQQMSQTAIPIMSPLAPSVVPPAQINSDEIFRELQQRALGMQIEQDRLEAEQRAEKEKTIDPDVPVVMIADTFPRRPVEEIPEQTPEEITEATISANIAVTTLDGNSGNLPESSDSSSPFFSFLDKEVNENVITLSPDKESEVIVKNDDVKQSAEDDAVHLAIAIANDAQGTMLKQDETAPQSQVNFVQGYFLTNSY